MCELRRAIVDVISCCVRLQAEENVSRDGTRTTSLRLVLHDPDTGDEVTLGDPVAVCRRDKPSKRR